MICRLMCFGFAYTIIVLACVALVFWPMTLAIIVTILVILICLGMFGYALGEMFIDMFCGD